MQQLQKTSIASLSDIGYYSNKEERREKFFKDETHIHKQGLLTGIKTGAHKLTNDIFTYFPKGFAGSKNSDFYEYLSMGMVPYVLGSFMLIFVSCGANKFFNAQDGAASNKAAKMMGAGVVLYAIGKFLHSKISHKFIQAFTGINLDLKYINKNAELPENGEEKGKVRIQYPGVFDSVQFFRNDLLSKDGELNHNNVFNYFDKIAKKAGFKNKLNSPQQTIDPKIREVKAKATALENIGKYVMAATGVALGAQKAFEEIKLPNKHNFTNLKAIASSLYSIANSSKEALKQLWAGNERNLATKHFGKALIIASIVTNILSWLIPVKSFKTNPDTMKAKIDTIKEYEVC